MPPARPDHAALLLDRKTQDDRASGALEAAMDMASSYAALIGLAEHLAYRSTANAGAAEYATTLFVATRKGQASVQALVQQLSGMDGGADEPIIVTGRKKNGGCQSLANGKLVPRPLAAASCVGEAGDYHRLPAPQP